jgi:hypothetical protein
MIFHEQSWYQHEKYFHGRIMALMTYSISQWIYSRQVLERTEEGKLGYHRAGKYQGQQHHPTLEQV